MKENCLIHLENEKRPKTEIKTLKSYLKQGIVAPTQLYLVWIR